MTEKTEQKKQLAKSERNFTPAELGAITDFQSAAKLLAEKKIAVEQASEYGTGFEVLKNKGVLEGIELIILDFNFTEGKQGLFVSCNIVTRDGRKIVINDGSTGIRDQLLAVVEDRERKGKPPYAPLHCPHGLNSSVYTVIDPSTGEETTATTYRLADVQG